MSSQTLTPRLPGFLQAVRDNICATLDSENLSHWQDHSPALSDALDAASVHDLLGTPFSGAMSCDEDTDAALLALLELASLGDTTAAQAILSCQLPWIASRVRRLTPLLGDLDEAISIYLNATLEVVSSFPLHRSRHVLMALHGLIVKRVHREVGRLGQVVPTDDFEVSGHKISTIWGTEGHPRSEEARLAVDLLARAHDAGALDTEQTLLLARSYLHDDVSREQIARELGISHAAARRRISQALRQLTSFTTLTIDPTVSTPLLRRAVCDGVLTQAEVDLLDRELNHSPQRPRGSARYETAVRCQVGRCVTKLARYVTKPKVAAKLQAA